MGIHISPPGGNDHTSDSAGNSVVVETSLQVIAL